MPTPVSAESAVVTTPAVDAVNSAGGDAVKGTSASGNGVHGLSTSSFGVLGESKTGRGVVALSDTDYALRAASRTMPGIRSSSELGTAIEGWSKGAATGVLGLNDANGFGLAGRSQDGTGADGASTNGTGVHGGSVAGRGVEGNSVGAYGVHGSSDKSAGIRGDSVAGRGVEGWSTATDGVFGNSLNGHGVTGFCEGAGVGVWGEAPNNGIGVHGRGGRLAALFEGDVEVTGDLRLLNADCAEDFALDDTVDSVEGSDVGPGTVVVLGEAEGSVACSTRAYDKRVAGVISGAGTYRPGIVLDNRAGVAGRVPVALLGKVFCRVDASYGAIEVGDLLTTSPTVGAAMRAADAQRAFGTVVGKALRPLAEGRGLIPILVALQ